METKRNWKVLVATRNGKSYCDGIVDADSWNSEDEYWERYIVQTDSGFYGPSLEDAQLIVSAPALYEALMLVRDSTAVLNHLDPEHLETIESALRQARGEK